MARSRQLGVALVAAILLVFTSASSVTANPVPPYIPPDAHWLTTLNYYRAMSGLPSVTENTALSQGAFNHSCYMLYNGISHDEIPGLPGYTTAGDNAGNNSNVAVSSVFGTSARSHIELWMTGPFHAIGMLRHNLQTVGFGKCDISNTPQWRSGATLNVLNGLAWIPRPSTPILFPGNGTTTNLNQFITESPNPLTFCGWSGSAGLPVIAMMPEAVTSAAASITGPSGPVETCRIFSGNTSGTAKSIMESENAVSVIPRNPLKAGKYTVTVTTQARTVTWGFTVDPLAATGVMPTPQILPTPQVVSAGAASGYTPVTPFRLADSRLSQRITRLTAGVPKRIRVAGVASLPSDVTAISANFTVVNPAAASWLTVYNCAAVAPTASTLNFGWGETVANAGIFPLSAEGDICVLSPVQTDLVFDVTGHFRSAVENSYNAIAPTPLIDTVNRLNAAGRLTADQTLQIDVPRANVGVPSNATAVAINVTGISSDAIGYITTYSCDIGRPNVSSVNPLPNLVKQNFAIVPISASGKLCFYTFTGVHMRVDVLGYFTGGGAGSIVPTSPLL